MSLIEVTVQGTLDEDGTLHLDEKPNLVPGRVTIVLRQEAEVELPADEPFFVMLREIWAMRSAAGLVSRSTQEVEAERRRLRDESAEEVEMAGRLQADAPKREGE